jgi:hypothetical protein
VLFLVDRRNLGRQALNEFRQYVTPDDGRKFSELYNVQHMQSNLLDPVSQVCITTIQRLYSMLRGEAEFDPALEEQSLWELGAGLERQPPREVVYNPSLPPSISTSSSSTSATARSTRLAPGAGVLRRLPDRPDRHAGEADLASSARTW